MAYCVYEQSTGLFLICDVEDGGQERVLQEYRGYSGKGSAKNVPAMQCAARRGPIPAGVWQIDPPRRRPALEALGIRDPLGPLVLPLRPHYATDTCGRSGFLIHGDSVKKPGTASEGCIILPRNAREAILEYGCRVLDVVPTLGTIVPYPLNAGTRTVTK